MVKTNFLNNKDILKEIHNSKNTYCVYIDDDFSVYDIILNDLSEINTETINQAIKNKTYRLNREIKNKNKEFGMNSSLIDETSIEVESLVFRIMTYEHIPLLDKSENITQKQNSSFNSMHEKLNFLPFKHFIIDSYDLTDDEYSNLKFKEVGKSHWKGGLHNGYFSSNHGKINNTLALMFLKLVERYSQKSNWRGYTYLEEMKGQALLQLSQVGLQFNEQRSSNPFAYYTEVMRNSFTRILNTERKVQDIRDELLIAGNSTPSYTKLNNHEEEMRIKNQS